MQTRPDLDMELINEGYVNGANHEEDGKEGAGDHDQIEY